MVEPCRGWPPMDHFPTPQKSRRGETTSFSTAGLFRASLLRKSTSAGTTTSAPHTKPNVRELLSFWEAARAKGVERVALCLGRIEEDDVTAPAAVYVAPSYWRGPAYLLVQHGSYQFVRVRAQPELEHGTVFLYRGVQKSSTFRFLCAGELHASRRWTWRRYLAVQAHVLSDATLSCWVAEHKFGPNYVVCKTPLTNIRMTTFFAGEHEARIVDPRCVEVVEAHGCAVEHVG
jgi:hypothetical protein